MAKKSGEIDYNVPLRLPMPGEDTEAMFRRLIEFSYAVGRQYRADGGRSEIEDAIRTAQNVGDQRAMSHMDGGPGVIEKQDVKLREPLSGYEMTVGRFPKQTAPAIEGALQTASEIAPYFTPAAPIAAARDIAVGLREGDMSDLAMSAFGVPGKLGRAVKAAAVGAYALEPEEAEAGVIGKALKGIRAYHGSPHSFDRFDISKIGTGEGAQAYGHGLYFAGNEDVARSYRGSPELKYARFSGHMSPVEEAVYDKILSGVDSHDTFTRLKSIGYSDEQLFDAIDKINPQKGSMYEVLINAEPEHFLDWDKPLSEQSPVVREVVKSVVPNVEKRGGPALSSEEFAAKYGSILRGTPYEALPERALTSVLSAGPEASKDFVELVRATNPEAASKLNRAIANYGSPTGAQIYHALGSSSATNANFLRAPDRGTEASAAFREAGIPGIKYLDAASRGAGEGSRNYVIFDDKLIDILRRYAQGGEVEREDFDKGGIAKAIRAAKSLVESAEKRIPLEVARERVASPFSDIPENVESALRYAQSLRVPQGEERIPGSFYNVKQTRPVSEVTSTVEDIPGVSTKEINPMSWEDIVRQYKGATMFNVAGDRSNLGRMTHINERELAWPVDLHAGPKYMLEPNEQMVWANNPAHATGFQKAISKAAKRGPVIGVYHPMGVQSVDSSHNMIDALLAQIGRGDVSKGEMRAADELLRRGAQAKKGKVQLAIDAMQNWPGFENAREASEFAKNLEGTRRSEIVKFLDKAPLLKQGFPAVGETRVAITDPALRDVAGNMLGHRVVEFDPDTLHPRTPSAFTHSTYTSPTAGRYVGDVPLVQTQYAMPDVERDIMTKLAKGDRVVHPYSHDPLGRSSWRKSFETRKLGQKVNQEMLDSIMLGLQRQSDYGFNEGGSVIDDALDVISALPQAAE